MAWSVIGVIAKKEDLDDLQIQTNHGEVPTETEQGQIDLAKRVVLSLIEESTDLTFPLRVNFGGNRPTDAHSMDRGYLAVSVAQSPDILPRPEG